MTPTKLQGKIYDLYTSYSEKFTDNRDYLKSISDIAGNRGLSHKERVRRIGNWLDQIGNSLNESQKDCFEQLLRINTNYVKTTSRTRKITNSHEVRENIYNIRKDIRSNKLENYVERKNQTSLTERAIAGITDITLPSGTPRIPEYSEYKNIEKAPGFWKRAGKTLAYTAIGIAGAVIIGCGSFFGGAHYEKKVQQPVINKKQEIINSQEKTMNIYEQLIKDKNNEIAEQRTAIALAGRPDEEVRKEARQNMVEEEKFDCLNSRFKKASNDYEELKIKNKNLRQNYIALENEKATSDAIGDELAEIVDYYVNEKATEKLNKCNKPAAAVVDCKICNKLGIQKQQYLIDEPWDYPKRLDKRCKQLNKKGKHLEDAITRVGWVTAVGNDALEGPVRFISGLGGGLLGAGSRIIGNKWDGFDNGWKNGDQFGAYVMDGFYGGVTKTEFDGRLLALDFKGALQIPYFMEDTKLGSHVKLAQVVGWDFVFPFVAHDIFNSGGHPGNSASGGFDRIGGELGPGTGRVGGAIQ